MKVPTASSEAQLEQLRREAELNGRVSRPGIRPPNAPFPTTSYYELPILKPPVWTWEVPTYFFVGGAGGAAAVIGFAARISGADPKLVRDARRAAAGAAHLSTPLLIADLGRPERFLNMLRIFKPQSPMSVGAWIVAAFGGASTAAVIFPRRLADVAAGTSAALGLGMATYTGVLLGATVIPLWSKSVRLLPVHFGASAVASAASALELMGNEQKALHRLALGAAAIETGLGVVLERRGVRSDLLRLGGALSGPIPLALRLMGRRTRRVAALSSLVGSLITRFAWVEAGKKSVTHTAATDRVDDIRSGSEKRNPIPPVSSDR